MTQSIKKLSFQWKLALPGGMLAALLLFPAKALQATPVYYTALCGEFFENIITNNTGSGTFACPTAASLGVSVPITSELLVYDSDYSSGLAANVSMVTDWSFSGATFTFAADTTTVTGASDSETTVSSDGLTLNPFVDLPPDLLAGFYDVATTFGTPTINWSTQPTQGSAVDNTGYVEVLYGTGTVTTPTPEPETIVLLGCGIVGMYFVRRLRGKV
jgi:hypothetical protein